MIEETKRLYEIYREMISKRKEMEHQPSTATTFEFNAQNLNFLIFDPCLILGESILRKAFHFPFFPNFFVVGGVGAIVTVCCLLVCSFLLWLLWLLWLLLLVWVVWVNKKNADCCPNAMGEWKKKRMAIIKITKCEFIQTFIDFWTNIS